MISKLSNNSHVMALRVKKNSFFTNFKEKRVLDYTHPVGLGSPATLQAPLAGPEGNRS
jgi:hypothetical protein